MRPTRLLPPIILLLYSLNGFARDLVPLSKYFPSAPANATVVINMGGQALALVGQITPEAVSSAARIITQSSGLRTLYVDSQGGDIVSAIELAKIIRLQKTRLVVAGRCFSACANYLFTGAISKDVLPGSLIGIHDVTYHFHRRNSLDSARRDDVQSIDRWHADDSTIKAKVRHIEKLERDFYISNRISLTYHLAFSSYEKRRRSTSDQRSRCPNYSLWILDKANMIQMGIKGLNEVWTPRSAKELQATMKNLGLQTDQVYFGSIATLDSACSRDQTSLDKALFDFRR